MIIAGPTGSGKSGLALDIAERLGGEIVNCDSVQIYRYLNIGTAKTPVDQRRGIPHYLQPHAFLPRGRRLLVDWAPDVLDALLDAGADPQDLTLKLHGPRQPGDEDLVYLWVRRPIIEWALRRAAAAEPAVDLRAGVPVAGLLTNENGAPRACVPPRRLISPRSITRSNRSQQRTL